MFERTTYRYIVPPVLFISFFISAGLTDCKIYETIKVISQTIPKDIIQGFFSLFAALIFIFSVGYLISSISTFILRLVGLFPMFPRGLSVYWRSQAKKELQFLYKFSDGHFNKKEAELAEQTFISEFYSPHLYNWLRGRWEHYYTNYNCFISVILVMIIVPILQISPVIYWWIICIIFVLIFGFNCWLSYWEVIDMDHFVLRNIYRIKKRKQKSTKLF